MLQDVVRVRKGFKIITKITSNIKNISKGYFKTARLHPR